MLVRHTCTAQLTMECSAPHCSTRLVKALCQPSCTPQLCHTLATVATNEVLQSLHVNVNVNTPLPLGSLNAINEAAAGCLRVGPEPDQFSLACWPDLATAGGFRAISELWMDTLPVCTGRLAARLSISSPFL